MKKEAGMDSKLHKQLHEAVSDFSSPCFIKDLSGVYIYINKSSADLAGLKPADFIGRSDADIFGQELGKIYSAKDQSVLRGEQISPLDIFTDASGVKRVYFITREVIYDESHSACGIMGVRTNITDHIDAISDLSGRL
jgi:PAS domain-containing protein